MAALHGKKGKATFTSLTFELTSFAVDVTCDTAESTVMSSVSVTSATHWKSYLAGFKDWTATAEAVLPAAGVGLAALGTEATLTMDTTDGKSWAGTAICTGIGIDNNADDVGRCSLSFQGVAAIAAT